MRGSRRRARGVARAAAHAAALLAWPAWAAAAGDAAVAAPSVVERTGVDAFALYEVANVRGLDAGRIIGNYRWNDLPVLNQTRAAAESAQRYDIQTGLRALETGYVYPGGVVDLVTKAPGAPENGFTARYSSASTRYAAADLGGGGLRLNAAGEEGGLALPGLAYSRAYAAIAAARRFGTSTEVEANLELQRGRERGEQATIYTNGLRVPSAPSARTLLGQTWAGTNGTDGIASLRVKQDLGGGWQAMVGLLRFDDRYEDNDFYGRLLPGGEYELTYARDPGQRHVSDTVHARISGETRTGFVSHRLEVGVTAMRARSIIHGAASTVLGTASLYAPRTYDPVFLAAASAPFEAQRATDSGMFVADRMRLSERLTLVGGYKTGSYRQSGANVVDPSDERYRLKSAGAIYAPAGDASRKPVFYASYGEALEQGTTVPLGAANAERVLPSYLTRQGEIGARFFPAPGLELEAALFRARKSYEYPNTADEYVQDGVLVHQGLEVKAVGSVGQDLRVFAAVLLVDPRVEKAREAAVDGQPALGVPRRFLKLVAEYSVTALAGLSVYASLEAYNRRPADAYGRTYIPGYGAPTLGAQYESKWLGERTTLRFEIENPADRGYWASVVGGYLSPATPRKAQLGLEIALR